MLTQHYRLPFISRNDENEHFELTFEVLPSRKMLLIINTQVYQRRGDTFCNVVSHVASNRTCLTVTSIINSMKFGIEIFAGLQSCEIFVVEQVLTTITHTQLAPQPQSHETH